MNLPYGSKKLVNRVVVAPKQRKELLKEASTLKSLVIEDRFLSDCEMIAVGGVTPLRGFMRKEEIESVLKRLELPNGLIWGIPIVLLVSECQVSSLKKKQKVALLDKKKNVIAVMEVVEKFKYPKDVYCKEVFKTLDLSHPGVRMLKESPNIFLAGPITLLAKPNRDNSFSHYYLDPSQTREEFEKRGWSTIVAFQTRNPIHRAHEYLIKCALEMVDGVLIHPLVGETKIDDVPADVRMECYKILIKNYFNSQRVLLSVLPTFMRYAGPREALNHAIIRKNYGCTHFIIGRDHAGVGNYYDHYEAQQLLSKYAKRINITPLKFEHAFYCNICKGMASLKTCPHSKEAHLYLSGSEIRVTLRNKKYLPEAFTRPEVTEVLLKWTKENH